jgi:DNA polymerase IV
VRYADFSTVTRARSLPTAVNDFGTVWHTAADLLRRLDPPQPVRLVGVRVAGLDEEDTPAAPDDQLTLAL